MGIMRTKKWIALGSVLMTLLAAGVALGEDYEPCYAAYRSSGLTEPQMPFKDFHELYSDTICT
jgi:hypothetical protein